MSARPHSACRRASTSGGRVVRRDRTFSSERTVSRGSTRDAARPAFYTIGIHGCRGCRARGPVWVASPETRQAARQGYRRSPTRFRFDRSGRGRSEITSLQPRADPFGSRCPKPMIRSPQRVDFGVSQFESHVAQRRQRLRRPVAEPGPKFLVSEDLPDDQLHRLMRHIDTRRLRAGVPDDPGAPSAPRDRSSHGSDGNAGAVTRASKDRQNQAVPRTCRTRLTVCLCPLCAHVRTGYSGESGFIASTGAQRPARFMYAERCSVAGSFASIRCSRTRQSALARLESTPLRRETESQTVPIRHASRPD
jgi:hypothetical protein